MSRRALNGRGARTLGRLKQLGRDPFARVTAFGIRL